MSLCQVIAKTALSWVLTVPIAAFTTSALSGIHSAHLTVTIT